jgi:hypothetical protein
VRADRFSRRLEKRDPGDVQVDSGLPVIRPERILCKPDYNLDRVSGLHPSVHKPDLSVWTGSVFE